MSYYVYFMANKSNSVLYTGVTNNIKSRVWQHKSAHDINCFTHQYNCHKLVYAEEHNDVKEAIAREKRLKKWKREWKNKLVNDFNPDWVDLYYEL